MTRLQKVIAHAGVASRRKAEEMIAQGRVKVNGELITEMGYKVNDSDVIQVDNKVIETQEPLVYYLINKPRGYLSSVSDPLERPVIVDLIDDPRRIYPVGRLDMDTTGALILTNDGSFAQKMTHPSYDVDKTYRVSVKGRMSFDVTHKLEKGLSVNDIYYEPMKVENYRYIEDKDRSVFDLTLYEGKNRQIRELMDHFELPVIRLHRFSIGPLNMASLKIGNYRMLKPFEIKQLLTYAERKQ
ncbi:MAG TPA: pseudouridine synthase [Erysipelothrix sp.]|nr:pseudouridine synthase [Erysipelothrix sp.]